jgi:hypothetical protein
MGFVPHSMRVLFSHVTCAQYVLHHMHGVACDGLSLRLITCCVVYTAMISVIITAAISGARAADYMHDVCATAS